MSGYHLPLTRSLGRSVVSGITVWGDALDLSSSATLTHQVVFHYTNFLAFKNITNEVGMSGAVWKMKYSLQS